MRLSNKVVLASTNTGKIEEFKSLFRAIPGIELVGAKSVLRNTDKLGMVETFDTFKENAVAKARLANQGCHYPCLADDSGLEVKVLGGEPGIHSKRYSIAKAGQTQDQANVEKMLDALRGVPMAQREARFVAHLALVIEGLVVHAEGFLEGTIAEAPQGNQGFGYDPIFIPKGSDKTLAEMNESDKNQISHRAVAFQNLTDIIKQKGITFARP